MFLRAGGVSLYGRTRMDGERKRPLWKRLLRDVGISFAGIGAAAVSALSGIGLAMYFSPVEIGRPDRVEEEVREEWMAELPSDSIEFGYVDDGFDRVSFTVGVDEVREEFEEGRENRSRSLTDYDSFIDPEPFEEIARAIYEDNETDRERVEEVWEFVKQNVEYELDDALNDTKEKVEVPLMPLETLHGGVGDCEDGAVLAASILEAMPADWDVNVVLMDRYSPDEITMSPFERTINHATVYIDTGRYAGFVEWTDDFRMDPFQYFETVEVIDDGYLQRIGVETPRYIP